MLPSFNDPPAYVRRVDVAKMVISVGTLLALLATYFLPLKSTR
jgi:hypothetical protein